MFYSSPLDPDPNLEGEGGELYESSLINQLKIALHHDKIK